jgi:hypothetical protein
MMGSEDLFWKRKKGISKRRIGNRGTPQQRFLIVCEGEKTEPNYFKAFPIQKELISIHIEGTGCNSESLVNKAVELKNKSAKNNENYERFNNTLQIAKKNKIECAYSNQAFELWYCLHFRYFDSRISRTQYFKIISNKDCLDYPYQKNDRTIYQKLLKFQPNAIRNAKKLIGKYQPINPEKDNPSTTVFRLVEELNKYLRR